MSEKNRGTQRLLSDLIGLSVVFKLCSKRLFLSAVAIGLFAISPPLFAESVSLAWDPSESTNVVAHRVHYGTASGNYSSSTNLGNQTTATISGLQAGTTYFFVVTALDDIGMESLPSNEVNYQVPLTNSLPTIVLTSPSSGSSYTAPATINLAASVTSNGHTITKVQFYSGATMLGEDMSAPYAFTWNNVNVGSYSLTARVVFDSGSTVTSSSASIAVTNPPPAIALTSPLSGSAFTAPAGIALAASVTANGHLISKVQFYNGTTLLGEDISAPYGFNWSNVSAGNYSLKALVVYGAGSNLASASVNVTVTNPPPTIVLTSPTVGATYAAPATIVCSASVNANGHSISKVQFYNGSMLLGEDSSAPYSIMLSNVSAGSYAITASALYGAESRVSSSLANVTVTGLPAPWQTLDIGAVGLTGSVSYSDGTYSVTGAGTINGTTDSFRFVYQPLSADGEIQCQLSLVGAEGLSGVMIRESLTAGSAHAFMGHIDSGKFRWQERSATSDSTTSKSVAKSTPPNVWLRLVRSGNTLFGYRSTDGHNWTLVNSRTIGMASNVYVGLAVSSGTSAPHTSSFNQVIVVP